MIVFARSELDQGKHRACHDPRRCQNEIDDFNDGVRLLFCFSSRGAGGEKWLRRASVVIARRRA
jgi:hypothetical protein